MGTIEVDITNRLLCRGIAKSRGHHPIALALNEAFPEEAPFLVGMQEVQSKKYFYLLEKKAQELIMDLDCGFSIEPDKISLLRAGKSR